MSPEIAVAISIYKADRIQYVIPAVDSVLRQLPEAPRVYIYLDGDVADDVSMYIHSISDRAIILGHRGANRGLAFCLNAMIDEILKDPAIRYIARMDADDISLGHRFSRQKRYMEERPRISVVGSWCREIDSGGNLRGLKITPCAFADVFRAAVKRNPLNHPTAFLRREVFDAGFRYSVDVGLTEDYRLWIDLLAAGYQIENLPEVLLHFRVTDQFVKKRGGFATAWNDMQVRFHAMSALRQWSLSGVAFALALGLFRLAPGGVVRYMYDRDRRRNPSRSSPD